MNFITLSFQVQHCRPNYAGIMYNRQFMKMSAKSDLKNDNI